MKIAVLASHTTSLFWFRMDMMKDFVKNGHTVIALGSEPEANWKDKFQESQVDYSQLPVERNGLNPFKDIKTFLALYKFMKKERPDKIFAYQAKTIIYGSLAARLNGISEIYLLIAGIGSVFIGTGFKNKLIKTIMKIQYRTACSLSRIIFFQNNDDKMEFIQNGLAQEYKTVIINGSGVNLDKFRPVPLPEQPACLFIGRLLKDKGIMEYLKACRSLKRKYPSLKCMLVGPYDSNPSSLKPEELKPYIENKMIDYYGEQRDVRPLISKCSVFVLPSYHEGTPKTVLEAMAMGRPVVTTNAPGCKETVIDGVNGFLIEVKNKYELADKIEYLINHPDKAREMGMAGYQRAKEKYDVRHVNYKIMETMGLIGEEGNIHMLYEKIINRKEKISVIGLGYVGMPIAVAFAKKADVIGFDVNKSKIDLYKSGIDPTREVGDEAIKNTTLDFTSDETRLKEAAFHIVAVPTPVNADHTPDLTPVKSASMILGRNLKKGSVVVYESTVFPGVTEEICLPILEKESGLKCGADFAIGYSPERINPGDKEHRLETIKKIVAGMDKETLDTIASVYELVVEAGVHRAESIKIAEAAKVIENSQRDINIAFMNELSIIFNKMGLDTKAVLEAAGSKWNFLKFYPGLVGGHCIGVDPYYLTYKAEAMGYHSQVILSGRKINDDMGKYVAENTVKKMIKAKKQVNGSRIAVFGVTFKENCPDVRNSKAIDIIRELEEYGIEVLVVDPSGDREDLWREYQIRPSEIEEISDIDAAIFAVAHDEFKKIKFDKLKEIFRSSTQNYVLIDVKGMFDRKEAEEQGFLYWRL